MNEALIEIAVPMFVFSSIGLIIALAIWIALSKPKPMGDCIRQAEAVIYQHQLQLNRQQRTVPKFEPNE